MNGGRWFLFFDEDDFVGFLSAIIPTGIASEEAFGTAIVLGQIVPTGISSEEAFGTATVRSSIVPTGIPSEEEFGIPSVGALFVPGSGYEIFLYDYDGTLQMLLEGWEYLEFTQRVNSPWNHIIRQELSFEDERADFYRNNVERDWIIEVYRTDEISGQRERVYEGLNRTTVDQAKKEGTLVFTFYGSGYLSLLKRRIVLPPAGLEHSQKSGIAETVIKQFVNESCVSPVDSDRIIPGLTIEADSALGNAAEYSARFTNLYTVVSRLAEQGQVDFGIVKGVTTGSFIFQVREIWGTDRRVGNVEGTVPTIFDIFYGNMEIPIFSNNASEERNVVYIAGQGQGVDRIVQEYENTAGSGASPWNRIESYVDARNEENADGLETQAQAHLNEYAFKPTLQFNIRQTEGTRWLRDWELGDIITSRYFDLEFNKKIVQVSVTVSAGDGGQSQNEVIAAELEDVE